VVPDHREKGNREIEEEGGKKKEERKRRKEKGGKKKKEEGKEKTKTKNGQHPHQNQKNILEKKNNFVASTPNASTIPCAVVTLVLNSYVVPSRNPFNSTVVNPERPDTTLFTCGGNRDRASLVALFCFNRAVAASNFREGG
jgi:hypothetical protein